MFSTSSQSFSNDASGTLRGRNGVPRSLFIGIGAWGTQVLSELRRELTGKYESLENLPTLAWLSLDYAGNSESNWAEEERLILDVDLSNENNWRHETVASSSELGRAVFNSKSAGDGGLRARARLGLWNVWPEIEANLRASLGSISLAQSGLKSAVRLGAIDDSLLNIYLVAHLGEATGGGAVIDLAYGLRSLLLNGLNGPTYTSRLLGVLALPENAAPQQNRALAYAALRELNHWNYSNTAWNSRGPAQAQFSANSSEIPFDFATLWTPQNAAGIALAKDDFARAVTQWLSLDVHPNLAPARNDDRSRLAEVSRAVDEWNQPANYFAAGVASLEFPREAVCHAVAARLAREAWERALAPQNLNGLWTAANEEAEKFARDFDYDAHLLLDELFLEPELGQQLRIGDLTALHEAQWLGNVSNLVEADPKSAQKLADDIYLQLAQVIAPRGIKNPYSLGSPAYFNLEGEIAAQVRERFSGLESKWRVAAHNFVGTHVDQPKWRADGTAKVIEILEQRLTDTRAILDAAQSEINEDINQAWLHFQAIFAQFEAKELQKNGGIFGRNTKKHQAGLAQQFAQLGADLGASMLKRQVVLALREAFTQASDLWVRPRSDLKRFTDAVQESGRAIRQRGEAWENAPSVIGHLVLHASNPVSIREAAILYTNDLSSKIEPPRNLNEDTPSLPALWKKIETGSDHKVFVAIMTHQGPQLADRLFNVALDWTRQSFQKSSALDLFKALYPDEHTAGNRLQELFRTADVFFPVALGTVIPGWSENQLRQLRRAGFHNAENELLRTEAENHFFAVTKSLGFSNNINASNENIGLSDPTRAVFWSEVGGFALRCGGGYIRDLENAYNSHIRSGQSPLHSRSDVPFWLPIEAPAPYIQEIVWRDFLVALATGAIEFSPLGDGTSGNFAIRSGGGVTSLGQGPNFATAFEASLIPWREVIFRCAEPEIQKLLNAHLEFLKAVSTKEILEKIASLLAVLTSSTLRHYLSDIFGEWKLQFLSGQEQKLEEQLVKIKAILDNPEQARLHETARQKQLEIQNELALLRGEVTPFNDQLSAEQELERLLAN